MKPFNIKVTKPSSVVFSKRFMAEYIQTLTADQYCMDLCLNMILFISLFDDCWTATQI